MTTDDFTAAAREKAAEGWLPTVAGRVRQMDFVTGAKWARDHFARQELTEEAVRASALVICEAMDGQDGLAEAEPCKTCINTARRALTAAKTAGDGDRPRRPS